MVPKSGGRAATSRTRARTREPTEIKVPEGTTVDIRVGFHECGPERAAR